MVQGLSQLTLNVQSFRYKRIHFYSKRPCFWWDQVHLKLELNDDLCQHSNIKDLELGSWSKRKWRSEKKILIKIYLHVYLAVIPVVQCGSFARHFVLSLVRSLLCTIMSKVLFQHIFRLSLSLYICSFCIAPEFYNHINLLACSYWSVKGRFSILFVNVT